MSARIVTRQLGNSALAAHRGCSTRWVSTCRPAIVTAVRHYSDKPSSESSQPIPSKKPSLDGKSLLKPEGEEPTVIETSSESASTKPQPDLSNPLLEKWLERQARQGKGATPPKIREGGLSQSTIFKPEYEIPGYHEDMTPEELEDVKEAVRRREKLVEQRRQYDLHAMKLDPAPELRKKWERKMVIKSLKRKGRLTKDMKLARTERESLFKSPSLPTSVKKLTKVVNQIQGKTVEEALVQLRFSKKKIARDVAKGLQIARDEAIAVRGMGLGANNISTAAKKAWEHSQDDNESAKEVEEKPYMADGSKIVPKAGAPTLIEMKDGKKKLVYDPTEIYIDQAWVGRGQYWKSPEFRARGRVNLLTHRTTNFSVLLKEEKTRMRLSDEIKEKRANRKLWQPLPDRPVTAQRQYCLW